jgi:hypothetical protein
MDSEPCPICGDTGLLPEDDPSDETFCACLAGQQLRDDEDAWAEWKSPS